MPPLLHSPASMKRFLGLLKETFAEAMDDDVMSMSAAIAYYAVFSLPALLVVILAIAGAVFGMDAVREALFGQVRGMAGDDTAGTIETMIQESSDVGGSVGARVMGGLVLLFGASGAFAQFQYALNRAWDVTKEEKGGLFGMLLKRLLSFGMILTVAFLLLVSLAVTAVVAALGSAVLGDASGGVAHLVMQGANLVVSLAVMTLLFAAMFVVLPDTRVAWRDVWIGAGFTAVLFTLGKTLIGLYIGQANPGSAFGAAGSLALVLIWIYYSSLIVLIGAEFTQVYARRHGSRKPSETGGGAGEEGPPPGPRSFPEGTLPIRT